MRTEGERPWLVLDSRFPGVTVSSGSFAHLPLCSPSFVHSYLPSHSSANTGFRFLSLIIVRRK